ncbi:MAG: DUF305 domain-containing protein [Thermomicrobiales bacterium]
MLFLAPSTFAQANQGTPAATLSWSCDSTGTPVAGSGQTMSATPQPMEDMAAMIEFDQLYIDMMLPHHGSIIALAQAALPRLSDPRLKEMAQNIIDTQSAEQAELTGYREAWYGSGSPDRSEHSMMMMIEAMPGMHSSMEMMMQQMDANQQVATFCAAENPDLAFIEQVIPHHQMAIDSSKDALGKAVHPETKAFAEKVIRDQQAEIEQLNQIKAELTSTATPTN